jgi:hypothetical protein
VLGDMLEHKIPEVTAVRHVREHAFWLRFSDGMDAVRPTAAIGLDARSFGYARRDESPCIAGMPETSRF